MVCSKCGAQIEEGTFFCLQCGEQVQLVPDYNPFDEIITNGIGEEPPTADSSVSNAEINNEKLPVEKKHKKRRKRKKLILIFVLAAIVLIGGSVGIVSVVNSNSYAHQIKQGKNSLEKRKYKDALNYLTKAAKLDKDKAEPYIVMADVYAAQEKTKDAISSLKTAVELEAENEQAYEKLIALYEEKSDMVEISMLMEEAPHEIRQVFFEYVADPPEFSEEEGVFNDWVTLELSTEHGDIYYTLNNTTADTSGELYSDALELDEGKTVVRAVVVNEKGVISREIVYTYEIELNLPDSLDVNPGTGRYTNDTQIVVNTDNLPEGAKVYYTYSKSGSTPTAESNEYKGAVSMKEGSNIFSAVIIYKNGKSSAVTRRNYELEYEHEEPDEEPIGESDIVEAELQ